MKYGTIIFSLEDLGSVLGTEACKRLGLTELAHKRIGVQLTLAAVGDQLSSITVTIHSPFNEQEQPK